MQQSRISIRQRLRSKTGLRADKKNFEKACDLDEGLGCSNLGLMFYNGHGVEQNKITAGEYLKKACDLGSTKGCDNLKALNEENR